MSIFEVRTFDAAGNQVGILPGVFAEFTDEFGTEGYVKVTVPKNSVASTMLSHRTEVGLFIEGVEVANSRALVMEHEGNEAEAGDAPGEAYMETWGGRTLFSRFRRAIVYPENWPAYYTPPGHSFSAVNAGNILKTLIDRAKARGAIPQITYSTWNATTDSNGVAWEKTLTITYEAGTTLLAVLENMIRLGAIEVRMFGRDLRVYNAGGFGVDRSSTIILRRGLQVVDSPYSESTDELVNTVLVMGDEGVMFERADSASVGIFGREEGGLSQGGTKDVGTLTAYSDTSLARTSGMRGEYTVKVEMFGVAGTVPFIDFFVGDWVSLSRFGTLVKYRVRQMSAVPEEDRWVVNITLNDKFAELDLLNAKKIEGILGGASADTIQPVTGSGDTSTPKAPTGLQVGTTAYIDTLGKPQGAATLSWTAPTENTDNTAVTDLYFYKVYMREDNNDLAAAPWRSIGDTGEDSSVTVFHYSPLPVGVWKRFAVVAVDETGRASTYSNEVRVYVNKDAGPPPKPSTPSLSTYLGSFVVTWDGYADGGGAMPADFAGVNVHISTNAAFDPAAVPVAAMLTVRDRASSVVISDLTYGTAYYVKFVAFDTSVPPNYSVPSTGASAIPQKVVGDDIEPGSISTGQVNFDATDLGAQAVFYGPSAPAANAINDFWVDTTNNNSLKRWDGDSWELVDNTLIAQAVTAAGVAQTAANNAMAKAVAAVQVYYQPSQPTGMVADNTYDLWVDTDNNELWVYNHPTWVRSQDQGIAQALQAAEAASNAQAFNTNPLFKNWAGTVPDNYTLLGAVNPTKETTLVRTAPNAVRFNVTNTSADWGLVESTDLDPLPINLQYVTVQADFQVTSGTLAGAGILLDWAGMTNNRAVLSFAAEISSLTLNKWYRVTKVMARPTNATGTQTGWNAWVAASYTGNGLTRATKNIIFDRVAWWPSSAEEILAYNAATAASVTTLTGTVNTKNTIFYQNTQPSTSNRVNGDVWYDTANGYKMYVWNGSWTASAFGVAAVAFTARQLGAITTYYQPDEPASGMIAGDLWIDTNDGNKVYRYSGSAWQLSDDQRIGAAITAAANAQATANSKIKTYAQDDAPTGLTAAEDGYLWIDTNDANKTYRWKGSTLQWVHLTNTDIATALTTANTATTTANNAATAAGNAITAAQTAQSTADGKAVVYYQDSQPIGQTAADNYDMWIETDNGNKLYVYSHPNWVLSQDQTAVSALMFAEAASNAQAFNANPTFKTWPGTLPTGFTLYGATNPTKETTLVRTAPNAVRFNVTNTTADWGLAESTDLDPLVIGLQYVTVEVDFQLTSGGLGGAGVLLDWVGMTGTIRTVLSLAASVPSPVLNKWYRVTKVMARPAGATGTQTGWNAWIMASFTGDGLTRALKNIVIDRVAFWPSSAEEILANTTAASVTTLTTTVNTKITAFYTDDPPSTSGRTTGDIWYDTNDGNKMYRWNGAWTSTTFGTAAINFTARQIGAITTYYQTTAPASGMITGDLWIDTSVAGKRQVYRYEGGWVLAADQRIGEAITAAAGAQAAADGKVRTFAQDAEPTGMLAADDGDLWIDTNDSNKLYRWSGTAWVAFDDTRIAAQAGQISTLQTNLTNATNALATARAIADGFIDTFFQTTAPSGGTVSEGDVWVDTDANNVSYRRSAAGTWVQITDTRLAQALSDAASAAAAADGKITSFYQASAPAGMTNSNAGDIWFDTDDGNKAYWYRSSVPGPAGWVAVPFGGGAIAPGSLSLTNMVSEIRASLGQTFYDDFSDVSRWSRLYGSSTMTATVATDARSGGAVGRILRVDDTTYRHSTIIPFDPNVLYRITVRVRENPLASTAARFSAGVIAYAADGTTRVDYLNSANGWWGHDQQYAAGVSSGDPGTVWTDYVGYLKGVGTSGTLGAYPDPKTPSKLHQNAKFIVPALWQHGGVAGDRFDVDMFKIEAVPTGLVERAHMALAIINSALIEDLAVITAKIGDLQVTNAKVNDIAANKITTAELAAGVRISAGPMDGSHAEMTATGFKAFVPPDETGGAAREVVSLGTGSGDIISVTDPVTQNPIAGINQSGFVTARGASIAPTSVDANGAPLGGFSIYGKEWLDYEWARPRGVIAWARRTTTMQYAAPHNTTYPYIRVNTMVSPNRLYKIWTSPMLAAATVSNGETIIDLRLQSNGSRAEVWDWVKQRTRIQHTNDYRYQNQAISALWSYSGSADVFLSALITVTGWDCSANVIAGDYDPVWLVIEDIGPAFADTAEWLDGTVPPPPPTRRLNSTWGCTATESFTGGNPGSPRGTYDAGHGIQGYSPEGGQGDQHSMHIFGGTSWGDQNLTLAQCYAQPGFTLVDCAVYLYYNHWWYGGGGTAIIRRHDSLDPSGWPPTNPAHHYGWARGEGKWVNMTGVWSNTTGYGVALGKSGGTNPTYYGRSNGVGQANAPMFSMTYDING